MRVGARRLGENVLRMIWIMDQLGLHSEWVVFRDMWRGLISKKTSDSESGRNGRF